MTYSSVFLAQTHSLLVDLAVKFTSIYTWLKNKDEWRSNLFDLTNILAVDSQLATMRTLGQSTITSHLTNQPVKRLQ
jgi:hypothetical protein